MTVLVDSCVVTDLADPQSAWYEWSAKTLEKLDREHRLVINPIIYAECSIAYERIEEVEALFEHLAFAVQPLPKEALFLAGKAFLRYRRQQGRKSGVLPDLFIGAHAAVAGYRLLTRDRGRFASYFPSVELIRPEKGYGVN